MEEIRNPDHYALVIGINRYPQFPPLAGAARDATLFAKWLLDKGGGGLPEQNLELLLSPPEPEPVEAFTAKPDHALVTKALSTKMKIEYAIRNKIPVGKRFYFYFSGHGFSPTIDEIGMLLPAAAPSRLKPAIGLRLYRDFFKTGSFFEEAVYIMDCCRDFLPGPVEEPQFPTPVPRFPFRDTKEAVITAAPWGAKAFEAQAGLDDRRGILTSALLDGLYGAPGAYDLLGRVTTSSLKAYLEKEVPSRATLINQKQPPHADPVANIVLAPLPKEKLAWTTVQIIAPPELKGTLDVLRADNSLVESRPAAQARENGATWLVELLSGFQYIVRHVDSRVSMQLDPSRSPFHFARVQ